MDLEKIVELDRINMSPILKELGIEFDPERRKNDLVREIEKGARFFLVRRGDILAAYLEYMPVSDNCWNVMSIQIHPAYKKSSILRAIFRQAYREMLSNRPKKVFSSAHKNNESSVRLHRRLGFRIVSEENERYRYEISGDELLGFFSCIFKRGN
ncbi:GNAT family N-acetyltransferase [Thermovorax subterraneus]|nr:GNAT family N-acetyltransferase [Thermovorax subterraneus]